MTVATVPATAREGAYAEAFQAREGARSAEPARLAGLRAEAMERFAELGFPTMRQEQWRFTNVGGLARTPFVPAAGAAPVERDRVAPYLYADMACLVFVDGYFAPGLSSVAGLPAGVTVGSVAAAVASGHPAVERLGSEASFAEQPFVALNTALFADGPFVHVPRGVAVERPVLVVHYATGSADAPVAGFPRTLVVAEEASQVTLIETFAGAGLSFTCPVAEVLAGPGAVVDHYTLQQHDREAYHVALQQYVAERDANVVGHNLSWGAALARTDVGARLVGPGVDATLDGLYLADGRQHVDHHMYVEHVAPHCASHELYKGILEGRARAVFNGLIHVYKGAQKTDAKQTNRNLLLSPDALVNTNPQLLIFADDVKCTHGSTVGQLDADAVFYLRSRGIGEEAAKSLLTWAFVAELVARIRVDAVRRDLEEYLFTRLPKGDIVRQAV